MVAKHLISTILFAIAVLLALLWLANMAALRGQSAVLLALVFVLAGIIFYRRGK